MTPIEGRTLYSLGDWWVGNSVEDDTGVVWRVTRDQGWVNPPKKRTNRTARPSQDGSFGSPAAWAERLISLEGKAEAPDKVERDRAKDRLAALFAMNHYLRLTVVEHHMTRWSFVELDAESIEINDLTPTVFEYVIDLAAPDPLKYGLEELIGPAILTQQDQEGRGLEYGDTDELSYGEDDSLDYGTEDDADQTSSLFIPNPGTMPLNARFVIEGPIPSPALAAPATGSSLRFGLDLPAGSRIDLLTRDRRPLLNGRGDLLSITTATRDWLQVPPGGLLVQVSGDEPNPLARFWAIAPNGAWI